MATKPPAPPRRSGGGLPPPPEFRGRRRGGGPHGKSYLPVTLYPDRPGHIVRPFNATAHDYTVTIGLTLYLMMACVCTVAIYAQKRR